MEIDLQRTAVIVIDMQHTFVSKGGKFDLRGEDISKTQTIIEPIKRITSTARAKGIHVIYVAHHHSPDFHDSGGPDSPNWYKSTITDYRERAKPQTGDTNTHVFEKHSARHRSLAYLCRL